MARQHQETCNFIGSSRKQKRLTRLSAKATVAVSFNDAYSFRDEEQEGLKQQGIKDQVEARGYTVKKYNNTFKMKRFDASIETWKTNYIEYTGFISLSIETL